MARQPNCLDLLYNNKTTYNMTTVELTPAEIQLIQLKREQEALVQKEAELKKAAKMQEEIAQREKHIKKLQTEDAAQVQATTSFNMELGLNWEIIITEKMETFKVNGDYLNPEDPKACDYQREILWQTEALRRSAYITHKVDPTFKIEVKEHWVSRRNSYRSSNEGYKMFLYGPDVDYKYQSKAIVKPKTINEKVEEIMEAKRAKVIAEAKKKSVLETTVDKMKSLYPDATVTPGTGYERNNYGRRTDYTSYDQIIIDFPNGIKITYKVYSDGSLGRKDITFNVKDSWELMDKLAKM